MNTHFQHAALRLVIVLFLCNCCFAQDTGQFMMCRPLQEKFHESFDAETVSKRWGIRQEFALKDGAICRTEHKPEESSRIFLKDTRLQNGIVRFDFRFEGADDIRLVTGAAGHYNTITHLKPDHFYIMTADDRESGFVPSYQGFCQHNFKPGKWYTMTVEFFEDQVIAHLDQQHFVVGQHPVIDRERTYLAFQVGRTSASIDNIKIWQATLQEDWKQKRMRLAGVQAQRTELDRNPAEQYNHVLLKLRDRLTRTDETFRQLIENHAQAKATLKQRFPEAYATHKELFKSVLKTRDRYRKEDPEFRPLQNRVYQAERAEKAFIHSRHPELEGLPDHLYYARFERSRQTFADDSALKKLSAITQQRREELVNKYPAAFAEVDVLVENRNALREKLKENADHQRLKQAVTLAYRAIRDHLYEAEPNLKSLEEARIAFQQQVK